MLQRCTSGIQPPLWKNVQCRFYRASKGNSKKRLQVPTPKIPSSKQKGARTHTNPDSMPPFRLGPYDKLALPEEQKREGLKKLISNITDFRELKILEPIRNALIEEIKYNTVARAQNYISPTKKTKTDGELAGMVIRPSPIQVAAIKIINDKRKPGEKFKVFTLAAETGSGKTWAYLAPLLQKLKEDEVFRLEDQSLGFASEKKAGIRSVILLPTHELVDQVYKTVETAGEKLGLNTLRWDTDSNFKVFMSNFSKGIDVLVTTPGKLQSLSKYPSITNFRMLLGSVRFCVVDEADTLMDKSFLPDTYGLIKNMSGVNDLVFVSATFPSEFNSTMGRLFPNAVPITTPALHKIPKAVEFRVIDASVNPFKGSKMKALAQTLYAIHCDGTERGFEKRAIVFVNTKDDCENVADILKNRYGHDVTYLSSEDQPEVRREKIKDFVEPPKPLEDLTRPLMKVLVCTDLVSRGLNFVGVRNVILLDVPKNTIDLIHRAGRTGRMKQSGRVFLIMTKSDSGFVRGLPSVIRNNRRLG